MKIKNALDVPLWVPESIKAPNKEATPGTMEAVWGKLAPGEEVEAPDAAVEAFAKQAGDRVKVRR